MTSLTFVAHASMIPGGVVATGWALWASSKADAAWLRWLAAATAPLGVLVAAIGTILVVIPDFFTR